MERLSQVFQELCGTLREQIIRRTLREKDSVREKDPYACGSYRASDNAFLDLDGPNKSITEVLKELDIVDVFDDESDVVYGEPLPEGKEFAKDHPFHSRSIMHSVIGKEIMLSK